MGDVKIPIPSIKLQDKIANIYKIYSFRKNKSNKINDLLKNICSILIKGSILNTKGE